MRSVWKFLLLVLFALQAQAGALEKSPIEQTDDRNWDIVGTNHFDAKTVWFIKENGETTRHYYVQLDPSSKPILFYSNERGIEPILGHRHRFMVVNDEFAVEANNIHVIDLTNGKDWLIDAEVDRAYSSLMQKDDDRNAIPYAKGISPDDSQVLIEIQLPPGDPSSPDEPYRSYKVDIKSGKILKEFKTPPSPTAWWVKEL